MCKRHDAATPKLGATYVQHGDAQHAIFTLYALLCCVTYHSEGDVDVTLCCIPSHVHHVIFELLKNSLNATITTHGGSTNGHIPPGVVNILKVRLIFMS
jgi:hypothetical protein